MTERIPATEVEVGDTLTVIGDIHFTVEWKRTWTDGGVYLAGLRSNGQPHVSNLSNGAMVWRVEGAYD